MKSTLNTILSIAFSVILPLIGMYSSTELTPQSVQDLISRWFFSFFVIFTLWHLLWRVSKSISPYKNWWKTGIVIVYFGIIYTLAVQNNFELQAHHMIRMFFAISLILIIQHTLKTQQNNLILSLEKEQIQTENYKSQLKALRTQIDPHFLFNSLNTLRSMVRQQHPNSEKFIISLSDFYRQVLKHNDNTTLELSKEIAVLQSYLFLMKNRHDDAISFHLNIDHSLYQHHLPTLALQVIIENCFKHNSMTSKRPLNIEIKSTDSFHIIVNNNIQPKIGDKESSGIGLNLLNKRYALMGFPKGVTINNNGSQFSVQLKLIKK